LKTNHFMRIFAINSLFIFIFMVMIENINGQKPSFVYNAADLEKNWGKNCLIYGEYKTMFLPNSARPDSPLMPSDRIVIMLSDSTLLALETHNLGIRSEIEKTSYLNAEVVVEGIIYQHMQLWGTPMETAILMNAITNIKSIEIIKKK
jgi:hypothetical protein